MPIERIQAPDFSSIPNLKHSFSTRNGGVSEGKYAHLNLGWSTGDEDEAVEENYRQLAGELGISRDHIVGVNQVHGADVLRVDSWLRRGDLASENADALITASNQIYLSVRVADCLPILLVDPERHVAGAVHAGWRGTLAKVLPATIAKLIKEFECEPSRIKMAIGPGIGGCCFEVSFGIASLMEQELDLKSEEKKEKGERVHLELAKINQRLAMEAGLARENIWNAKRCTKCESSEFFSYRRDGKQSGRQVGIIGWDA